jgi:hypothetical protein
MIVAQVDGKFTWLGRDGDRRQGRRGLETVGGAEGQASGFDWGA